MYFIYQIFSFYVVNLNIKMDDFMTMIDKELNNLVKVFNNIETNRQTETIIYDGGLTQTIVYFNQKYNIRIGSINIPGNTLLEISNNSFNNINPKPDLITNNKNDMFIDIYLKKYYFNNSFYNFADVMNEFRSTKSNETVKQKDSTLKGVKLVDTPVDPDPRISTPIWISMLQSVLLGILALQEKPSLGLKNANELQPYIIYINKIVDDFISGYKNKTEINYFFVLWVNQLVNKNSTNIKNTYYDTINYLLKEYTKNDGNMIKLDYGDNELINYHYNLMCFGIIKDYFLSEENKLYFYQRSMKSEKFKNINLSIEGFENKEENNKKEKKKNKEERISTSKFLLYCLIFGCVLLLGTSSVIIFWKILINLYNKYS